MTETFIWAKSSDLITRFGEAELLKAAGVGAQSNRTLDADKIAAALSDAHAEVSARLSARYELPQNSDLLKRIVCDLARHRLRNRSEAVKAGDGSISDVVRQRFEDANDLLMRIASGKASLPNATERTTTQPRHVVHFESGRDEFSKGLSKSGVQGR